MLGAASSYSHVKTFALHQREEGRSSERSEDILVNLAKCGIILFTLGEHYDTIVQIKYGSFSRGILL